MQHACEQRPGWSCSRQGCLSLLVGSGSCGLGLVGFKGCCGSEVPHRCCLAAAYQRAGARCVSCVVLSATHSGNHVECIDGKAAIEAGGTISTHLLGVTGPRRIQSRTLISCAIGALPFRIGFWGISSYTSFKEPSPRVWVILRAPMLSLYELLG